MNGWINECMNEWMNEWMIEWTNGWLPQHYVGRPVLSTLGCSLQSGFHTVHPGRREDDN